MKYHYEFEVRTCNLNWGSLFLGRFRSYSDAYHCGQCANKGVFNIRKIRVYE